MYKTPFISKYMIFRTLVEREDIQSRLVRGIGPSSPTGTDD
jgi:hypothetical protein